MESTPVGTASEDVEPRRSDSAVPRRACCGGRPVGLPAGERSLEIVADPRRNEGTDPW